MVLITGASRGLGRAAAEGFASLGARTILVGRDLAALEETARLTAAAGGAGSEIIQTDISDPADIDRMVDTVKKGHDRLDVLLNNAGIGHRIPSEDVTPDQWMSVINTNLSSAFYASSRVAKEFMIPAGRGKIVNTASMGGFSGIPMSTAYSASKAGLMGMTRSLATEWAKHNIQVNCICPHYTKTDMIKPLMGYEAWVRLVESRTPIGRLAEPEETVGAALFLASSMASYITGTYIQIDGGCLAAGF